MRQLLLSSALWVTSLSVQKPDIYMWLEQNSYICDLSTNREGPHFLFADESKEYKCDCGDPLISQSACARRGTESPSCHEIPDLCMREYVILFAETENRLTQPLSTGVTVNTIAPPVFTTLAEIIPVLPKRTLSSLPAIRMLSKNNTFTFQSRFPFTRRSSQSRGLARAISRSQLSSRFRLPSRAEIHPPKRRASSITNNNSKFNSGAGNSRRNAADFSTTAGDTVISVKIEPTIGRAEAMTMVSSMTTTVALPLNSSTFIVEETATEAPTATALPMSTIRETTTITTKPTATIPIATSAIVESITVTATPNLGTIVWQTVMAKKLEQPERAVMKAVRIQPSVRLEPKNNTLNGIKMPKTNLKLPTLTSRIKALRDKEPEHPLIDLQEFLSVGKKDEGQLKDRNSSTARSSTVKTNGMPEIMEKGVNRESKTTLADKISRQQSEQTLTGERTSSHVENDPLIIQTNSAGLLIKISEMGKREAVTMTVKRENDEEKDEGTMEEPVIQFNSTSTKKVLPKQNSILHKVDGNTSIWEFTRGEERAELLLQKKAIDYLRAKIESLEKQLTERFQRNTLANSKDTEDSSNLLSSHDETMDDRLKYPLDSHQWDALHRGDNEDSLLKNVTNFVLYDGSGLASSEDYFAHHDGSGFALSESDDDEYGDGGRWKKVTASESSLLTANEVQKRNSFTDEAKAPATKPTSLFDVTKDEGEVDHTRALPLYYVCAVITLPPPLLLLPVDDAECLDPVSCASFPEQLQHDRPRFTHPHIGIGS
ncbi:unnamed protein product [Angiostrongylus costaricensis]|uniref:ShKT domain-containing protein n=1 Tax=Angiostrongylus costaricensis TaxID=334426 RepID=A0A158PGE2_ANGCS|nr:unnamed protein product [Angiostrongylus costaricensis]